MAEKQNVPASSLAELHKIIAGYASVDSPMSLADASKATGVNKTTISGNAKFLVDLGLIHGGNSKQVTAIGRKYSRALEYKQENVARRVLVECVQQNEFISGLVTTVRIRDGMSVDSFTKHVLFAADQKNTGPNRTGARTIADLLVNAGMLNKIDDKLTVARTPSPDEVEDEIGGEQPKPSAEPSIEDPPKPNEELDRNPRSRQPSVTINITLQIPEVDDPDVYDRFFKAMKDNLFPDE